MAVESGAQFCREIEAYLCRKNDGHLIRIVGPAFEQVMGWAARGVPFTVACRGIDRCFERYYAKGPRRRPVRIEFCAADVLDAFDEWRRAVGVATEPAAAEQPQRYGSLPAHLERVIARLTILRSGRDLPYAGQIDAIVGELDAQRGAAKTLRGEARQRVLDRLVALDGELLAAARESLDAAALRAVETEAGEELAPFKPRLSPDALERAQRAAVDRLVRDRLRLPTLTFD